MSLSKPDFHGDHQEPCFWVQVQTKNRLEIRFHQQKDFEGPLDLSQLDGFLQSRAGLTQCLIMDHTAPDWRLLSPDDWSQFCNLVRLHLLKLRVFVGKAMFMATDRHWQELLECLSEKVLCVSMAQFGCDMPLTFHQIGKIANLISLTLQKFHVPGRAIDDSYISPQACQNLAVSIGQSPILRAVHISKWVLQDSPQCWESLLTALYSHDELEDVQVRRFGWDVVDPETNRSFLDHQHKGPDLHRAGLGIVALGAIQRFRGVKKVTVSDQQFRFVKTVTEYGRSHRGGQSTSVDVHHFEMVRAAVAMTPSETAPTGTVSQKTPSESEKENATVSTPTDNNIVAPTPQVLGVVSINNPSTRSGSITPKHRNGRPWSTLRGSPVPPPSPPSVDRQSIYGKDSNADIDPTRTPSSPHSNGELGLSALAITNTNTNTDFADCV